MDSTYCYDSVHREQQIPSGRQLSCKVIGLYGIPGSGKSHLLDLLKKELKPEEFEFWEGSGAIDSVTPGGLSTFQDMDDQGKQHYRQKAINHIQTRCIQSQKTAVVTGHFMFWDEGQSVQRVCTQSDLDVFTHILYINPPVDLINKRRLQDGRKIRPAVSTQHLENWQEQEMGELRDVCRGNNILFATLHPNLEKRLASVLQDFRCHDEEYNLTLTEEQLDRVLSVNAGGLETVILMDADRTLTAQDTGQLFWSYTAAAATAAAAGGAENERSSPLTTLFQSPLGYSYNGFRQSMLLYEEIAEDTFDARCDWVASHTTMYSEFLNLLRATAEHPHIRPVIITCGQRRVWEKILTRAQLSDTVALIGGGRMEDGYVVTPLVKEVLATRVKTVHNAYLWAFGDSPLDLGMLKRADQAIVIVGDEQTRSKSMDAELALAISKGDDTQRFRQAILSNTPATSPRLNTTDLPVVDLTKADFLAAMLAHHHHHHHQGSLGKLRLFHATETGGAQVLMTPMRDSNVSGPGLRRAHSATGQHLALRFLTEVIGLEEVPIRHVQGRTTTGKQLFREADTLIVAMMRGGEPMALGINDVFPSARLLHGTTPESIRPEHLTNVATVILVDSVINTGHSIVSFVQRIWHLDEAVKVVVVAGVVQEHAVSDSTARIPQLARHKNLTLVALRLSANKYTGTGVTDTGNRLFNTVHLP